MTVKLTVKLSRDFRNCCGSEDLRCCETIEWE